MGGDAMPSPQRNRPCSIRDGILSRLSARSSPVLVQGARSVLGLRRTVYYSEEELNMATKKKARGASGERFYTRVQLAGRGGVQDGQHSNKRESIRAVKATVKQGAFGSSGAVWMLCGYTMDGAKPVGGKRTLIFQCSMKYNRAGKLVLKIDEL